MLTNSLHRAAIHEICTRHLTKEYRDSWFGADSLFNTQYVTGWLSGYHFITSSTFECSQHVEQPIVKFQIRQLIIKERRIQTKLGFESIEQALNYLEQHP
jgi:hypothetical protein